MEDSAAVEVAMRRQRAIILAMLIQVGIMCERCGTVYFISHPDATLKCIKRTPSSIVSGEYTLNCLPPCGAVRTFHKNDSKAYSVSTSCLDQGLARKGSYQEQASIPSLYRS
jgi:hypothetical protein